MSDINYDIFEVCYDRKINSGNFSRQHVDMSIYWIVADGTTWVQSIIVIYTFRRIHGKLLLRN